LRVRRLNAVRVQRAQGCGPHARERHVNAVAPAAAGAGEQIMNTALVWIYEMLGRIK